MLSGLGHQEKVDQSGKAELSKQPCDRAAAQPPVVTPWTPSRAYLHKLSIDISQICLLGPDMQGHDVGPKSWHACMTSATLAEALLEETHAQEQASPAFCALPEGRRGGGPIKYRARAEAPAAWGSGAFKLPSLEICKQPR